MTLDDAYANAAYIPDADMFIQRWTEEAAAFRQAMSLQRRARLGLMYGHGTRQTFDLFLPAGEPVGLLVFVHGGYWLRFDNSNWSHFSEGALAQDWAVAMPSYDLCPRVRISDITRQIADAVSAAAHEIAGPVRLTGHSAGGHLVSRMAQPGLLPDDVRERVAHIAPISPVSDLRPLMQTSMNDDLKIDDALAQQESPIFQPKPDIPVSIWVGSDERPAFLDQANWLGAAWETPANIVEGRHHFDVIDGLRESGSKMMRTILS